ncbi:hypothetical protein EB796_013633 [Bugula neritina]|uniref:Uncharacterized protein n=1 Tax=Bugula neritina TaxID=10212 RepID=A0A7J7JRI4_BUGNE|nr:hypothetical protein EB796_013633 [Bugula neritina]
MVIVRWRGHYQWIQTGMGFEQKFVYASRQMVEFRYNITYSLYHNLGDEPITLMLYSIKVHDSSSVSIVYMIK